MQLYILQQIYCMQIQQSSEWQLELEQSLFSCSQNIASYFQAVGAYIGSLRSIKSLKCQVNKVDLIIYIMKELPLPQISALGFKEYYQSVTHQPLFLLNSPSYMVLKIYQKYRWHHYLRSPSEIKCERDDRCSTRISASPHCSTGKHIQL